jgi:hypothetical protein
MKLMQGSLAILAVAGLLAAGIAPAAADSPVTAQTAKKKCGKKGKKGAVAAKKKCKKKAGATGPSLPVGAYSCDYGSFQVQAGNRYTVNGGDQGSYAYNPALGHVDFKGGSYDTFYGIYHADSKVLELYSAINDPPVEIGDYGWSCSYSG